MGRRSKLKALEWVRKTAKEGMRAGLGEGLSLWLEGGRKQGKEWMGEDDRGWEEGGRRVSGNECRS